MEIVDARGHEIADAEAARGQRQLEVAAVGHVVGTLVWPGPAEDVAPDVHQKGAAKRLGRHPHGGQIPLHPAASRLRTEGCAATASRKARAPSRILSSSPAAKRTSRLASSLIRASPALRCSRSVYSCKANAGAAASRTSRYTRPTRLSFVPPPSTGAVVRLTAQLPRRVCYLLRPCQRLAGE